MVGVREGVTDGAGVRDAEFEMVGVTDAVSEMVGVTDGVCEIVGVTDGVRDLVGDGEEFNTEISAQFQNSSPYFGPHQPRFTPVHHEFSSGNSWK